MITPAFAASLPVSTGTQPPSLKLVAATIALPKMVPLEKGTAMPEIPEPAGSGQGLCGGEGISAGEWDDLFGAVTARLHKTATEPPHLPTGPFVIGVAPTLAAVVLECVDAMAKLRVLLAQRRQEVLFSPVVVAGARQTGEPGHGLDRPDHRRM